MAEPTAPKGAPPPRHFGHGPLAQRLAHEVFDSLLPAGERRSELHPKTTGRLGPALVVGVFGEWGAGKSYLLSEVGDEIKALRGRRAEALAQRHLPDTEAGEPPTEITVLVEFNAWRFEREPHLLIPMLKVAEQALRKTLTQELPDDVRQREALSDRLALLSVLTQGLYDRGGREAIQLLLTAVSSPVTLPKASKAEGPEKPSLGELYKSTKASLAKARELPAGVTHESLYFGFYEHLSAITGRNPKALEAFRLRLTQGGIGWWPRLWHRIKQLFRWLGQGQTRKPVEMTVNLIFMVDDLDRCLPEKAIEVLEAVKLFLDVEGCAFVLALDEEVVERGIAHRYQAYTSAAQGQTPITGAEYLEKLIHLPIRLPRPHGSEAQQYLADHWPQLYAKLPSVSPPLEPNELAKLVATLAPPVPRKLQRLTSLVLLNESLAGQLAAKDRSAMPGAEQRRWLVLMCALQLFAPSLFRYLRLHGADLLLELALWRKDMRLRDLTALSQELRSETLAVTEPYKLREAYAREGLPERIQAVLSNRSGFSLLSWLEQLQQQQDRAAPDGITLQRLLALAVAEAVVPLVAPHPAARAPEPSEAAEMADGVSEYLDPSGELLQAPSQIPPSPIPLDSSSPIESAWVLRSDGKLLRARLENEFALWEPLMAGDPAFVEKALTREGEVLAGKFLPESFVDRLVNHAKGPNNFWLTWPLAQRKPLVQLVGPLLTQGDLLRLAEIDFANLSVFERPSWAAELRVERFAGLKSVYSARTPWFEADGNWMWLPFAEPITGPVAQALVGPRAWVAHPIRVSASGSTLALGADGECGLYLDLTLKGATQRLRWMEPGSFLMGSPDGQGNPNEHPQHVVTLREGFWLADTLCTQSVWMAVMGVNPSHVTGVDAVTELPVECVSSEDVTEFLQQLASLLPAQLKPDLPTEAEWEYACRAGSQTLYWWGNDVQDGVNWAGSDGLGTTTPVRTYSPNPWGLHDMYGNVREWCADDQRRYSMDERVDPKGSVSGQSRAVRGGSYSDAPSISTSASRGRRSRDYRSQFQGFRFALRPFNPGAA